MARTDKKTVKRIDSLTDAQRAMFDSHADKWIEIGLRTGPADRATFEKAARECYEHAKIPWPGRVIWVSSPIVIALAAPIAALLIQLRKRGAVRDAVDVAVDGAVGDAVDVAVRGAVRGAVDVAVRGAVRGAVDVAVDGAVGVAVRGAVRGAVDVAVRGAVDGAVRGAVDDAVGDAVRGAVDDAVDGAVDVAVRDAVDVAVDDAVDGAVRGAVDGAVRGAVGDAVRGAVDDAVDGAVGDAAIRQAIADVIRRGWYYVMGGQLWVGGWGWGGAYTSFFREICNLELPDNLWSRGISYEQTMESACWWYPHRDFVMVCERPTAIHRELVNPDRPRGWGSHRLHRVDGPAVAWPDGWGIYAIHGVRIPGWIIERPQDISVSRIDSEQNAEIRRVMVERYGLSRYMQDSGAEVVHELPENYFLKGLQGARLLRKEQPGDEPILTIAVKNSTPEPDGSIKDYLLRVDPNAYAGMASRDCHAAMASTWRYEDGSLVFQRPSDYCPRVET